MATEAPPSFQPFCEFIPGLVYLNKWFRKLSFEFKCVFTVANRTKKMRFAGSAAEKNFFFRSNLLTANTQISIYDWMTAS